MPKELTHWIIAQRSLEALDVGSRTAALLRDYYYFYLAGAVLPDTLLHPVRSSHAGLARELADFFHDARDNSYAPLIRLEESGNSPLSPETTACLLGVLCHMQADIVFHPFVYSVAGWNDIGKHYRLETEIDCCLIRRGARSPVRNFHEIISHGMRETLQEICSLLFDPQGRLPQDVVTDALEMHLKYQGMYDSFVWKTVAAVGGRLPLRNLRQQRHLFYPMFRSARESFPPGEGSWNHPVTGQLQQTSLTDLMNAAVARCAELFSIFEGKNSFKAVLEPACGENLLTGLYGVQKEKLNIRGEDAD